MLSLRASPHFGTGHYQLLTVRDNHIVSGKHYGIAVDTSISCTSESILYAFIDTLSAEDKITVVTFGTHSEKRTFSAIEPGIKQHVADMLRTYQTGSNLMVGLSELEGDEYILISDGLFNEGPGIENLSPQRPLICLSSQISPAMRDIARLTGGQYEILGHVKEAASIRRIIRRVLHKPDPIYFDIKLKCDTRTIYVTALPRGGIQTFLLPTMKDGIATLSYKDENGQCYTDQCPFKNTYEFNNTADKFIPCVSPLKRPVMRKCEMVEYS